MNLIMVTVLRLQRNMDVVVLFVLLRNIILLNFLLTRFID